MHKWIKNALETRTF